MTDTDDIKALKCRIAELEKERDGAIRARDDHFRNATRLARRCVEAEQVVHAIRKILNPENKELIELGAKALFVHDERGADDMIDGESVRAWFSLTEDQTSAEAIHDKSIVDDYRGQSHRLLRIVLTRSLDGIFINKL